MSGMDIAILVTVFVIMDLVIIGAVLYAAGRSSGLGELAQRNPSRPPLPGAVRREFQGLAAGMIKLGGCFHITVDETHLHIDPSWFARRLVRMKPMSVPWERVVLAKDDRGTGRWARALVDGVDIRAPRWCLDLTRNTPAG